MTTSQLVSNHVRGSHGFIPTITPIVDFILVERISAFSEYLAANKPSKK